MVTYNYYIKVKRYYILFDGVRQDPVTVTSLSKATPFRTEQDAITKARFKGLTDYEIVKKRL